MKFDFKSLFRKKQAENNKPKEMKDYYDIAPIDNTGAAYRMIMGQRSNGKTYSVTKHIIEDYFLLGRRAVYVRRWAEDITPKNIQNLFQPHLKLIEELSGGKYNEVTYRANEFRLCYINEEGKVEVKDPTAFCFTKSINVSEHGKGPDAGEIHIVCFDEFTTREGYLPNEFIKFCNVLSSIIRDRDDCIIYMLGNTVNRYCPYFKEMGLKDVETMPQGEIRVYHYGTSDLSVAVEYCDEVKATKKVASKFFAFDNPQLEMITTGAWELAMYPRAPYKIHEEDIWKVFYIKFVDNLLKGEIIKRDKDLFIFFHPQTKDIKIGDKEVLYIDVFSAGVCHVHFLNDCPTELHKLIRSLILKASVCFSDNECGEVFRNWLKEIQGINLF